MNFNDKIKLYDKLKQGGKWLAAVRIELQHRFRNGDDVKWSSNDVLEPHATVKDIEEIVLNAVRTHMEELLDNTEIVLVDKPFTEEHKERDYCCPFENDSNCSVEGHRAELCCKEYCPLLQKDILVRIKKWGE